LVCDRVLWRGSDAKCNASKWIVRLAPGAYVLLSKVGSRWQWFEGTRDDVLASLGDDDLVAATDVVMARDVPGKFAVGAVVHNLNWKQRPFAYTDSTRRRIRHVASELELVIVTTRPWLALGVAPVTRRQAARLQGHATPSTDDAPWTGFDLEELRGLFRDGLRLPTVKERAAAQRAGVLVGVPGIDELANVTASAMEIADAATGAIMNQSITDLGKLDSIGRPIPHPVPHTVAVRLALDDPGAVTG
jgi:hypothetical protein